MTDNNAEELPPDLQNQMLAMLAFLPEGKELLDIPPKSYTKNMSSIAAVLHAHWTEFGNPPGPVHIPELFKVQIAGKTGPLIAKILEELPDLANELDPAVVLKYKTKFVHTQRLLTATIIAHKHIDAGRLHEAEQVMRDATEENLNGSEAPGMQTVCASDIKVRAVAWVWMGRIPRGKQTSIVGDPDGGKTTVALDIAAHITRGTSWPDGESCPQGNVLFISAEDDPEDTLTPRLLAADADLECVHFLKVFRKRNQEGEILPAPFSLTEVAELRKTVKQIGNMCAVIFDPAMAFVGGRADANKNSDVRGLLGPLNTLAAEENFALIFVDHLNKSSTLDAMYRLGGSIAWVANARSALLVSKDPEDETGERRLLLRLKCNLAKDPGGLAFTLEPQHVRQLGGQKVVRTKWIEGVVIQTARDVLSPASAASHAPKTDEAAEWLKQRLKDGPVAAKIIRDDADTNGIAWETLKRAKKLARVIAEKERGNHAGWSWRLPVIGDIPLSSSTPSEGMEGIYITPLTSLLSLTPSPPLTPLVEQEVKGGKGVKEFKEVISPPSDGCRPPLRRIRMNQP